MSQPGLDHLHLGLRLGQLAGLLGLEFQPLAERLLLAGEGLDLLLDPRPAGLEFFHERRGGLEFVVCLQLGALGGRPGGAQRSQVVQDGAGQVQAGLGRFELER